MAPALRIRGLSPDARRRLATALRRTRTGLARLAGGAVRRLLAGGATPRERPLTDYKAPNLWLDYRAGFVRRGLPGELLRRAVGGPPTYRQAQATAVGLSRAATLSIVPMAVRVAGRAPDPWPRAAAAALLLLSPLTCSLLGLDVGRYDAVGALALALMAARSVWLPLPLPLGAALLGTAVGLATASEEFLLAVLAPTAMAAVGAAVPAGTSRLRRLTVVGAVLGPGAVVAAASLLVPAPKGALRAAREEAARAGVGPAGPMGDALDALDRGPVENLAFFRLFRPAAVVLSLGLWGGLYGLTASALRALLGAGDGYRALVAVHTVVGAALSGVGTDFRRWWGLALLGLVASVGLADPAVGEHPASPAAVAGAAALALAGLAVRDLEVYPWGGPRADPSLRRAG